MGAAARAVGGGGGGPWPAGTCASRSAWTRAIAVARTAAAVSLMASPVLARLLWRSAEAAVHRLHEPVRRPATAAGAVASLIIANQARRLHLLQRHPLLDGVDKPISDHRVHIPVLDHVGFISEPAMSRNHIRAGLLFFRRYGQIDDVVERIDDPLKASSLID